MKDRERTEKFALFLDRCRQHIRDVQKRKCTLENDQSRGFFGWLGGLEFKFNNSDEDAETVESALWQIVENPRLLDTGAQRLWRAIKEEGIEPLPEELHYFYRNPESIKSYTALSGLKGIHGSLHRVVRDIRGAALNFELARSILGWISHPGYGKSEVLRIIKGLLEGTEMYILKDCPNNDQVPWILPRSMHEEFEDEFNLIVDHYAEPSDICRSCRQRLIRDYNYDFLQFPVERVEISARATQGIYTSYPKDQFQDSVTEFTGDIELGKSPNDPDAMEPGAESLAQYGVMFLEEWLRREPETFHASISASQGGEIQAPGRLGTLSVVGTRIFTSNEEVWELFKNDSTNSPYLSRMKIVRWPRNLILSEELKVIEKMLGKSDVADQIHTPRWSLELIARMFIASVLEGIEDDEAGLDEINRRIDLYNGALPEDVGYDKKCYEVREEKGDGYKPGLAVRELKEITDVLLAQIAIDQEFEGRDEEEIEFCLPPCEVFNYILKYLKKNDRFSSVLLKRLSSFVMHVYRNLIFDIKVDLLDESLVRRKCRNVFDDLMDSKDYNADLAESLGISEEEVPEFKDELSFYHDHAGVKDFVLWLAVSDIPLNDETVDRQQVLNRDDEDGERIWCEHCLRDVMDENDLDNLV